MTSDVVRRAAAVASCIAVVAALCMTASAQTLVRVPYVGAVTDSSAVIAVWIVGGASVRIEYSPDTLFASGRRAVVTAPVPSAPDTMVKVTLDGLLAATRYHYRIIGQSGADTSAPRSFETFPRAGIDAPVSFFFGSCQQSRATDTGAVFDVAADLTGDLFVQMGDWAYPDVRVPGYPSSDTTVRASYLVRLDTSYPFPARVLAEMPIAYVWDDHDSFGDNSNGASPADVKERVARGYAAYVPHYPLANPDAGIWQSVRLGNVELFLLDSRSQRSPIDSALRGGQFDPPEGHSMLAGYPTVGVDQRRWLLDGLRSSTARWKVIVSPVPFNPAMAPGISLALLVGRMDIAQSFAEYWAGYPADIDSLVDLFEAGYGRNVLVVSGSAHTNMYDDGTHSVVPEFVSANLDIPNTNLRDTLARYGLNVWTAGQTGSNNTVGRVRVETTPVHRLIVESFDESGEIELQYTMVDSSTTGAPVEDHAVFDVLDATMADGVLTVRLSTHPVAPVTVELYDVAGALAFARVVRTDDATIEVPVAVASGAYMVRVTVGEKVRTFKLGK